MQEYTSAGTSINTVTRVYKKVKFPSGSLVLDYGGGKYDTNTEYLRKQDVKLIVFDPYNRTEYHNNCVLKQCKEKGKSTLKYVVCANVLNVIKEDNIVLDVLYSIYGLVSNDCIIYIQVYEGDKSGIGKKTTKGYQRNTKIKEYLKFIENVFYDSKITIKDSIVKIEVVKNEI